MNDRIDNKKKVRIMPSIIIVIKNFIKLQIKRFVFIEIRVGKIQK